MIKAGMLIVILLVLPLRLIGCPLEGYWKSDEEKTLASFRRSKDITVKQREIFENNFFGKLYIHIQCKEMTSVMGDWIETAKYELISSSSKVMTIKYVSELEGEVVRKVTIEGECYSLQVNNAQFKEYFCPVSAKAYAEYKQKT